MQNIIKTARCIVYTIPINTQFPAFVNMTHLLLNESNHIQSDFSIFIIKISFESHIKELNGLRMNSPCFLFEFKSERVSYLKYKTAGYTVY